MSNLSSNLTDAVNDSLGDLINDVVEGVVKQAGVRDLYYIYLQKICSGSFATKNDSNADGVKVADCRSWEDAGNSATSPFICHENQLTNPGISVLSKSLHSSVVIGDTRITIPLLAKLTSSLDGILHLFGAIRRTTFAFLIITLIGSILSVVSILPAMYFPQSRLLVYFNLFWAGLATMSAFIVAILLSAVVVLASMEKALSDIAGVQIQLGGMMLLFVWLGFIFMGLVTFYWTSVWFVETRKSSFVKRRRDEDEVGHWRGIGKEIWCDIKGRRRKPRLREGI